MFKKVKTNERALREESDLKRGVNQKEMATNLRVLPMLLIHPVGFISTGRIKSHRAASYDTRAIKTDGTHNCYTGTLVQPDGSARNCFHEKFRYTRYGSFYSLSLKSSTKTVQGSMNGAALIFLQRFLI